MTPQAQWDRCQCGGPLCQDGSTLWFRMDAGDDDQPGEVC